MAERYDLDESIRMQECFEWAAKYAENHNLWVGPDSRGYYNKPMEQTPPREKLAVLERMAMIAFRAGKSASAEISGVIDDELDEDGFAPF